MKCVFVLNEESSLQIEQSINVMEQKKTICSAQNIFKKAVKAMSTLEMHYTFQGLAMARAVAVTAAAVLPSAESQHLSYSNACLEEDR